MQPPTPSCSPPGAAAAPSAPPARASALNVADVLRWGVVAASVAALGWHIWLLWTAQFHSQDGPAHLFAATALRDLLTGGTGVLADIYAPNIEPDPNWITYPVLSLALGAVSHRVAELALVTGLVAGLAGALYYAVTARGHAAGPVAVAGFAVAVGWSVHTGLYNFTASVALLLVVAGYHLRVVQRMNVWRVAVLAVLLVLLYFSHPLSLVAAYLVIGLVELTSAVADAVARRSARLAAGRLAGLVLAVAPSAALLTWFLTDPGAVTPRETPRGVWESLVGTALFQWPIQAVTRDDVVWATALAWSTWVVVVVLLGWRVARRDWSRWDVLLLAPLIFGVCAVVLPDRLAGGTLLQPRLALYALLALLLWVGVAGADAAPLRWLGPALGVAGVVALAGLGAVRMAPYREISAAVAEVRTAADVVLPRRTVLGAVSSRAPNMSPVVPLVHITDLVALDAGAVPVSTLDAGTGYGPIRYRRRFDPGPALRGYPRNRTQGRDQTPEQFRNFVRQYAEVTGRPFDYILLVAYDLRPVELDQFDEMGFRLVTRTHPAGLAHVFEVTPRVLPEVEEDRPPRAVTARRGTRPIDGSLRGRR